MNARWIALMVLSAVGLGLVAGRVTAGGHEEKGGGAAPAYTPPTPGDEHKELAKSVGEWSAKMSYWMNGQEITSDDSETAKMVMKGWFLEADYSGTMMGQPWKGRSISGYDQRAQEYVTVWYSEMESAISVYRGKKCPKGIIHLHGKGFNMQTQKMEPTIMQVHPQAEDGSHRMEMHWAADKKPKEGGKMMQIVYTKK